MDYPSFISDARTVRPYIWEEFINWGVYEDNHFQFIYSNSCNKLKNPAPDITVEEVEKGFLKLTILLYLQIYKENHNTENTPKALSPGEGNHLQCERLLIKVEGVENKRFNDFIYVN